jgi:hypothetical protein
MGTKESLKRMAEEHIRSRANPQPTSVASIEHVTEYQHSAKLRRCSYARSHERFGGRQIELGEETAAVTQRSEPSDFVGRDDQGTSVVALTPDAEAVAILMKLSHKLPNESITLIICSPISVIGPSWQ